MMTSNARHTRHAITKRLALTLLPALIAALLLAPGSARASNATSVTGAVRGIEVCTQEFCGAAIFVGHFDGSMDDTAGAGSWWVVVHHEDLPAPGERARITDGRWGLVVGDHALGGGITTGSILNNGDGTFTVMPQMDIRSGGEGTLSLSISLDHSPFPPTVVGTVGADAAAPDAPRPAPAPGSNAA